MVKEEPEEGDDIEMFSKRCCSSFGEEVQMWKLNGEEAWVTIVAIASSRGGAWGGEGGGISPFK